MLGGLEKHWLRGRGILEGWGGSVREFKTITYHSLLEPKVPNLLDLSFVASRSSFNSEPKEVKPVFAKNPIPHFLV